MSESWTRHSIRSSFWSGRRKEWVIPVFASAVLLQLLFLGNMAYIYGALFKSSGRTHALKVLALDYDGGEVGTALSVAYQALKGNHFPTFEFRPASEFPSREAIRDVVCKQDYWAAVYSHPGASRRLMAAIEGNNATPYNPMDTVTYIYDGVYFPIIEASLLEANMRTLISVASRVYYGVAFNARAAVNLSDPVSSSAFLDPIRASSDIIAPTLHGTRVLMNTVSMVMPMLMQFFFLLAMNSAFTEAELFTKLSKSEVYIFRLIIAKIYTFIGALAMTGYLWAFREDWPVDAGQFAKTWMCLWLYMDINHVIIDALLVTAIPIAFFSFFLLTWVIFNVASSIWPFPLSAGFYRWAYALLTHNTWRLLMEIWSDGYVRHKEVVLLVLLAWWVVGHLASAWSVRKKCVTAEAEARQQESDLGQPPGEQEAKRTQDHGLAVMSSYATRRMERSSVEDVSRVETQGSSEERYESRSTINVILSGLDEEARRA